MNDSKWDKGPKKSTEDKNVAEEWIGNPVKSVTKRLSIEIPADLHYNLKMTALQKNIKMRELVLELLETFVHKN